MNKAIVMLVAGMGMIGFGLVGLVLIGSFLFVINTFENTSEINDCKAWQAQAQVLTAFYLTQWQADQCAAHNIKVNAPVK